MKTALLIKPTYWHLMNTMRQSQFTMTNVKVAWNVLDLLARICNFKAALRLYSTYTVHIQTSLLANTIHNLLMHKAAILITKRTTLRMMLLEKATALLHRLQFVVIFNTLSLRLANANPVFTTKFKYFMFIAQ